MFLYYGTVITFMNNFLFSAIALNYTSGSAMYQSIYTVKQM